MRTPKQLANLKPIKKGEIRNPNGARAHSPETKALRKLTKDEVEEIGSLIVKGNLTAIEKVLLDPKASVIKVWIASVALKAINRGDMGALSTLLDRLIGKVKDKVEVTGENGSPLTFVDFIKIAHKSTRNDLKS